MNIPMGGLERDVDSDDEDPVYKKKTSAEDGQEDLMKQMLSKNMMNLPGATPMNTQMEEEND